MKKSNLFAYLRKKVSMMKMLVLLNRPEGDIDFKNAYQCFLVLFNAFWCFFVLVKSYRKKKNQKKRNNNLNYNTTNIYFIMIIIINNNHQK